MACAFDRSLKQRACNCLLNCFQCLVVASCLSDTDMCNAFVCHNGLYVREIQVDQRRQVDQVGNALYRLLQNFVCFSERLRHGCPAVYDLEQLIVRNYNQSVNVFFQFFNSHQSIAHTGLCFEFKRFGNNAYGQDAHFLRNACNNRCSSGSGSAAHTTGNKYHVCAFHHLFQFLNALLSGFLAYLRFCSCAQSLGQLFADL